MLGNEKIEGKWMDTDHQDHLRLPVRGLPICMWQSQLYTVVLQFALSSSKVN